MIDKALEALERMRPYIGFEHTEDYRLVKQALNNTSSEEDVNLMLSLAYQGYNMGYDYEIGFFVELYNNKVYTPNKFASDFDSELQARISIMKEYLKTQGVGNQ